jgi:hypothetical protein
MSDDFAERVARRRLAEIEAGRAHATAAWKSAEAEDDVYSAGEAYKLISEFNQEEQRVRRDYKQHVASRNPPAPPAQSDSEFMAKDASRMDYNDVHRIASKSRYGAPDDTLFRAGIAEVQRRRARGE